MFTVFFFFFFNDTATTEIYTLSLHDALPICDFPVKRKRFRPALQGGQRLRAPERGRRQILRSEEHTSELQSPCNLVCRLLLEKKKNKMNTMNPLNTLLLNPLLAVSHLTHAS